VTRWIFKIALIAVPIIMKHLRNDRQKKERPLS